MSPTNPVSGRGTHEIRLGVWATEDQAREIAERISRVLCADPEHAGPCEVPWSIARRPPEDLEDEDYAELVEQAKVEGTW